MPNMSLDFPRLKLRFGPMKFRYAPWSTYPITIIPSTRLTEIVFVWGWDKEVLEKKIIAMKKIR